MGHAPICADAERELIFELETGCRYLARSNRPRTAAGKSEEKVAARGDTAVSASSVAAPFSGGTLLAVVNLS